MFFLINHLRFFFSCSGNLSFFQRWCRICGFVLCVVNDAILVNSQRGGSNQTSRITDRDGKGSIFSASKAVCVERKWVHSASMMLITRLHVSPVLAFLQAGNRQSDWIYCFMSRLKSRKETWAGAGSRCTNIEIMTHYKPDRIQRFRWQTHTDLMLSLWFILPRFVQFWSLKTLRFLYQTWLKSLKYSSIVDPHKVYQQQIWCNNLRRFWSKNADYFPVQASQMWWFVAFLCCFFIL